MLHRVLTGDLRTVGLIENVRSLTSLVQTMKAKQDSIADDIAKVKEMEKTRTNIRLGEEKAARRLRNFLYVIGSLLLTGSGTVLGLLGRFLVTAGTPP